MPKSVRKSIQTCFRVIFLKKIYARCSTEGRVIENFQNFFFSKFQECPKVFPKVSKRVLNVFWGKFFEKFFLPSVPWKVEFSKISKKNVFKIPKTPKIVPKGIQTCFDCNLDIFFQKIFAQFSMEGRVFENFQKNQKICKIPKMPKIVPKSMQTCFELVWVKFFEKFFCPVFRGGSSFRKFSKKMSSKFQKCPIVFPKVSKRVLNLFCGKFFEKFYAQCSLEGRVFENFLTNQKFLKIQKCPKLFPTVSKHDLNMFWGKLFEKNFAQFSMECRVFENFQFFFFQNSKNAQKCSQKYPNVF